MNRLYFSRELNEVVEIKEYLTAEEALMLLCNELLGDDWYITDSVPGQRANAIIVQEILKRYASRKRIK